jgi:hypothetical protein
MLRSNCAEFGYCALSGLQTGSITLEMRSKRIKVRGHRAITQFFGVGRIVDDRYSARVSSSDRSRKAIVCRLNSLTEVFGPLWLAPKMSRIPVDSGVTIDNRYLDGQPQIALGALFKLKLIAGGFLSVDGMHPSGCGTPSSPAKR